MPGPDTLDLTWARWRKSSHSSANGQCVEVAYLGSFVAVRDSKNPAGPTLVFPARARAAFLRDHGYLAAVTAQIRHDWGGRREPPPPRPREPNGRAAASKAARSGFDSRLGRLGRVRPASRAGRQEGMS